MATTTNYGWTTPDDTALVKDGASAIRTLGTSVDTTTKNLNPSTTLGDIEYRSSTANTNTRVGIGTSGQALTVVAGVPSWAASPTSVLTTTGDSLYASAANTLARLGIGTTGQVLTVAAGLPSWATPASGGMTIIASGSLSGTSVSLTSIPQTYVNLYLTVLNRKHGTANKAAAIQLNANTGTSYSTSTTYGSDTSANITTADSTFIRAGGDALTTGTIESQENYLIYNYASTTVKKIVNIQTYTQMTGSTMGNRIGLFFSTGAVSSIQIMGESATTLTGGTYILYGVK